MRKGQKEGDNYGFADLGNGSKEVRVSVGDNYRVYSVYSSNFTGIAREILGGVAVKFNFIARCHRLAPPWQDGRGDLI